MVLSIDQTIALFAIASVIAMIITFSVLFWPEKKERKPKKKNLKRISRKNRKDLIKRIKSMTVEQFDAYYETLVEIYGRECFYKTFSKRYVKKLMEK